MKNPEISVILPCRNEEQALDSCLKKIKQVIKENKLDAEIIVSDSSTDSSPNIAKRHKVVLVKHKEGYGDAYLEAFKVAKGKYIFMADSDCSYDFSEMPRFIKFLKEGCDLVIGDRFRGKIEKGAMPFSRRIGNPILSGLFRLFFKSKINDAHSGMRALKKSCLEKLDLKTLGMEFASEMLIKAIRKNMKIKEVPINYYKRKGDSKLRSLSDGWRHLRFMLLYSPLFLFFIPGAVLLFLGIASLITFYLANPSLLGVKLYIHPMFVSALLTIIGYQLIIFSVFAKVYSAIHLNEKTKFELIFKFLTLKKAGIISAVLILLGLFLYILILSKWISSGMGSLNEIKNSILALVLITIGVQTIFSSFMLSVLSIKEK